MSDDEQKSEFEALESESSLLAEFWEFLCENKKFWMIPIIVVLGLFGLLIMLGSTSAAPFIYTLF